MFINKNKTADIKGNKMNGLQRRVRSTIRTSHN